MFKEQSKHANILLIITLNSAITESESLSLCNYDVMPIFLSCRDIKIIRIP